MIAGGSCYNCHQLSPQETSHGTPGPSLGHSDTLTAEQIKDLVAYLVDPESQVNKQ